MNEKQRRFLIERLEAARATKPRQWDPTGVPVPATVKAAQAAIEKANRVVSGWESRVRVLQRKRTNAISEAFIEAKKVILFGEPKASLKAVDKFEKTRY